MEEVGLEPGEMLAAPLPLVCVTEDDTTSITPTTTRSPSNNLFAQVLLTSLTSSVVQGLFKSK